ncbi:MAG: DEAD/DEAH box helicase, partial [Candidatus Omnitrophica bacterium]|nr:DEAD/DEAH box helicase [Candidatus Omnitrophota bacterium]
ALIVAPTRELAVQSMDHLKNLSRYVHLRGLAVYGGVPMDPQIRTLAQGLDIISATPGRLLDHVYSGRIDFGALQVVVLDEADRMMDMGFLPDVQRILSFLPPKRQNLIFSATIPDDILRLAQKICHDPVRVQVGMKSQTAAGIRQAVYPVSQHQKTDLLLRLLKNRTDEMESVIVFTRTKSRADRLGQSLMRSGIRVSVIHGDRSQMQRLRALDQFGSGRAQVLVATDVAARGLDIKDVSHVVNFDVPHAPDDYIHRVGRTARAQATGDAFTLVSPDEEEFLREIESATRQTLPRVTLPDFHYEKSGPRPQAGHTPRPSGGFQRRGGQGGHHRPSGHSSHSQHPHTRNR